MSPEKISGRMKIKSYGGMISRQTIDRLVTQKCGFELLPRKGKRYRQRKDVEAGDRLISNRVDIEELPDHVDLKENIGRWEGDTIYGQDRYLVTVTERVSKLLLTARVKKSSDTSHQKNASAF